MTVSFKKKPLDIVTAELNPTDESFELISAKQFDRILKTNTSPCFVLLLESTEPCTDLMSEDYRECLNLDVISEFPEVFPSELPKTLPLDVPLTTILT